MGKQIIDFLKQKISNLSGTKAINVEILRNAIKEELQYYVLDFIYHHREYSKWIMYGGSALRICHGLNRFSVDLDFEIDKEITKSFLDSLKKEIAEHFLKNYELGVNTLNVKITGRGLWLRFLIGNDIGISHPSKQVNVKIDLNHFFAPKTVIERIPVNHDQLSFVINTYNMSALMASKVAAVLLRRARGVGKAIYQEKGRDIYDLLWYMEKKTIPDLDYLFAKNIDIADLRTLFDRLTLQMNKVNKTNLKQDLSPLFLDQNYINNWLENWHESYLRLVEGYNIQTIIGLREIRISQDFSTDNYSFIFTYNTDSNELATIVYTLSDYWVIFEKGGISVKIDHSLTPLIYITTGKEISDWMKQYATLFNKKNSDYFKRTNNMMLGDIIQTKIICTPAIDNFDQKEQIILNHSGLNSCTLEDLMK